jgi:hypothetical protein
MALVGLALTALLQIAAPAPTQAQQAWLMTYGTAERIEEQFGHNAIWIRDTERGIDSVYNFGFFDFDKPGFYREYVFGEMIYFALARSPADELAYYRWRDRSVRAQRLALSPAVVRRLAEWLEARVQPETREFRYDYYFNNCSNRVRDALDFALDGALSARTRAMPAQLDFRQHTRRLIQDAPLLYTGIHAGLGRMADQPRTRWEEMFLPEVVAETVSNMVIEGPDGSPVPLVASDRVLYPSTRPDPPAEPGSTWPAFALAGLLTAGLVLLPASFFGRSRFAAALGARGWILFSGLSGLVLLFLWVATEHEAAWRNENLLLLNPLNLLLLRFAGGRSERAAAVCVVGSLVAALLLKLLPGAQWNYDLLLWLVPAQLALLSTWWRRAGRALAAPSDLGRR